MKRIEPRQLQNLLERDEAYVLDVRSQSAFEEATEHIPGDHRRSPDEVEQWYDRLPRDQHMVTYCT